MAENTSAAALRYYELVRQGVAPAEAFKQAFPNGIPTAADRAKEAASEQQKQALGQVGGTLAGALGTAYLVKNVPGWLSTEASKEVTKEVSKEVASQVAKETGVNVAQQTASQAGSQIAGNAASTFDISGGTMYPDGASYPAAPGGAEVATEGVGSYIGPAISTAATLKGGYDVFKAQQNGGQGIRGAATTFGAGVGSFGGPVGAAAGAAMGNLAGYGLQGDGIKNDLALAANPITWPLLAAKKFGVDLMHKTTKQHQQEKWAQMAQSEDPATAAYAQQYLDVIAQGDGSGKTFEDITGQEGGGSGRDVWGASAFFDAFKDKGGWLNTTEAQREAIAKRALDEGLLTGDHGDIVATGDDALNRIRLIGDEVMSTGQNIPQQTSGSQLVGALGGAVKPLAPAPLNKPSFGANNYKPYTPPNLDPNDPNKYGIDASGNVIGTLIGYAPQGSNMSNGITGVFNGAPAQLNKQEISNVGNFGNQLINALSKTQNNPNSPGFKNGKRIVY